MRIRILVVNCDSIFCDDSFWNDPQNKDFVENIEEADKCFIEFSSYFNRIDSVLRKKVQRSGTKMMVNIYRLN